MEEQTGTTSERTRVPELIRPVEGRIVAGVAKGLSDRLEVPLWLVRAGFIGLALLGGLGVALYGAGWLLVRSEDEPESIASGLFSDLSSARSWIGIALIVVAAMVVLDTFTFFDGGAVFAVGLLVVGVLLYTGQIPGGGSREASATSPEPPPPVAPPLPDPSDGADEPPLPHDGAEAVSPPPPPPREKSLLGRLTMGAMLIAAGILAILDNISALPIDAGPRHYLALAVTLAGLGLLVGAFVGRARGLILLGVLLLPAVVVSPVFEYDWASDEFEIFVSPDDFDDLNQEYDIEVGNLIIDLSELPWDGQTIEIVARAEAGNIEIYIPEEVGILGQANVEIGRVATPGRTSAGLGEPTLEFSEDGPMGTVVLEATVEIGNIDIHRRP